MNILVLGHLVLDEIHTFDNKVIESFGGVYFPLSAFSNTVADDDTIHPVFPVGHDAWKAFHEAAELLRCTDVRGCVRVDQANTRVRLFHDAQSQYNTQLVTSLSPVPFAAFSGLLPAVDLVYINMMTGDDITIDTAEELRRNTTALTYLDLHMIVYRVRKDGHRELSPASTWKRWVNVADIIQCNERELRALIDPAQNEAESIRTVFSHSDLRMIVVTKGEHGATVYTRQGGVIHIPPVPASTIIDSTGCGDTFGSVFSYTFRKTNDIAAAGRNAALAATFVLGIPGSTGMNALRPLLLERSS
jgi:hypothetical protein